MVYVEVPRETAITQILNPKLLTPRLRKHSPIVRGHHWEEDTAGHGANVSKGGWCLFEVKGLGTRVEGLGSKALGSSSVGLRFGGWLDLVGGFR